MGDRARWNDPKTNPCLEEAKQSYKCMDENNYNRDACQRYFDVYNKCKKQMLWTDPGDAKPFRKLYYAERALVYNTTLKLNKYSEEYRIRMLHGDKEVH